jgi:hypothetical protein
MSIKGGPNIVTDGLVLHLDAADKNSYPGSGSTWYDLSGNNHGALTNGPVFDNSNAGSLIFDNVNDYVSLGTPSSLNAVQVPLTICVWAKSNGFGSYDVLWGVDKSTSGGALYSMMRLDYGVFKYYTSTSSGGFQARGTFTASANVWNFYAVVMSGSIASPIVTMYLNNSSETSTFSSLSATPDLTVDFRIGSNQRANECWNGNISNVMWYNQPLQQKEIQQNYLATKGRFGL